MINSGLCGICEEGFSEDIKKTSRLKEKKVAKQHKPLKSQDVSRAGGGYCCSRWAWHSLVPSSGFVPDDDGGWNFLIRKTSNYEAFKVHDAKSWQKLDRSWQSDSSLAKVQPMNEWRGRNNTLGCRHNTVFITIQLLLCEVRVDGCVVSLHVGLRILSGVPSWKIVSSQLAITCEKLTIIQFLETARKNVRIVHAVP